MSSMMKLENLRCVIPIQGFKTFLESRKKDLRLWIYKQVKMYLLKYKWNHYVSILKLAFIRVFTNFKSYIRTEGIIWHFGK